MRYLSFSLAQINVVFLSFVVVAVVLNFNMSFGGGIQTIARGVWWRGWGRKEQLLVSGVSSWC